jgi:hypothetical protein
MIVGSVIYATSQGLGHLAKSFFDAGVINKVMIYQHPHGEAVAPTHTEWYPEGTHVIRSRSIDGEAVERFLDDVDVVLFFETPFDWAFANRCHERGVKTVIIPMYEWFLERPPHKFDMFINPSLLDQRYFPEGIHIPIPVEDHITWSPRKNAIKFLHNAGNIGSKNHKGTLELLKSMAHLTMPIDLTIRCQKPEGIYKLLHEAALPKGCVQPHIITGEIPRKQLFDDQYDVYIAPEKYNGLSLPLQEAFASGMMVMTTNRFPANTWLPTAPLIPASMTRTTQVMGGHLKFEESVIDPEAIAMCLDGWYGRNIELISLAGKSYAEANSWTVLKPLYIAALESVL